MTPPAAPTWRWWKKPLGAGALLLLACSAWIASQYSIHLQQTLPPFAVPTPLAMAQSVCDPIVHECRRRLTWDELRLLLEADTPAYISRLPEMQRFYRRAQEGMRQRYRSMGDHIREHKFGAPCRDNAEGKRVCEFPSLPLTQAPASPSLATALNSTGAGALSELPPLPASVVFPNDFPYALSQDEPIHHSVIWTREPLAGRDSPTVLRLLEHHFPAHKFDVQYLVNPLILQSIRDVFHFHVFFRHKDWREKKAAAAAAAAAVAAGTETTEAKERNAALEKDESREA